MFNVNNQSNPAAGQENNITETIQERVTTTITALGAIVGVLVALITVALIVVCLVIYKRRLAVRQQRYVTKSIQCMHYLELLTLSENNFCIS